MLMQAVCASSLHLTTGPCCLGCQLGRVADNPERSDHNGPRSGNGALRVAMIARFVMFPSRRELLECSASTFVIVCAHNRSHPAQAATTLSKATATCALVGEVLTMRWRGA
jgi:hypothetical protein